MSSEQRQPPPPPPRLSTPPQPPLQQQQQQPANDSTPSPSKRQRVNSVGGDNNNTGANSDNNNEQQDGDNIFDSDALQYKHEWESAHFLEVNLFGVYCSSPKCAHNQTLQRRGPNCWIPSHNVMREHWNRNRCYPVGTPVARKAEKQLRSKQIQLHNQLQRSTQQAVDKLIAAEFPSNCKVLNGKYSYCVNCGFFAKRKPDMKAHFGGKTGKMECNVSQHLQDGGEVLEGIHGIKCPRALVELVRKKQFKLPYHHAPANEPNTNPTTVTARTVTARTPSSRRQQSKFAHFYFL